MRCEYKQKRVSCAPAIVSAPYAAKAASTPIPSAMRESSAPAPAANNYIAYRKSTTPAPTAKVADDRCYNCNKLGHFAKDCLALRAVRLAEIKEEELEEGEAHSGNRDA